MKVELSERARARVERLVDAGEYPSVEAALEAAVEHLEPRDVTPEEVAKAAAEGRADFAAGRFRDGDEFAAELRALAESRPVR